MTAPVADPNEDREETSDPLLIRGGIQWPRDPGMEDVFQRLREDDRNWRDMGR